MTETPATPTVADLPTVREVSMVTPDLRFRPQVHRHPWHELVLVVEGDYRVTIGDERWVGAPGDLFCYPAGCEHGSTYDRDLSTRLFVLAWEGGPELGGPWRRRDSDGRVLNLLHWMRELQPPARTLQADLQRMLCAALLLHLSGADGATDPAERAHEFLGRNLEHPIDLQQVAGVIGVGPRRLNQLYRARYGRPPMRDLARLRAMAAARLLRDERLDLEAIATRVGLGSASALSRLLKRELGRRPSDLRRRG